MFGFLLWRLLDLVYGYTVYRNYGIPFTKNTVYRNIGISFIPVQWTHTGIPVITKYHGYQYNPVYRVLYVSIPGFKPKWTVYKLSIPLETLYCYQYPLYVCRPFLGKSQKRKFFNSPAPLPPSSLNAVRTFCFVYPWNKSFFP